MDEKKLTIISEQFFGLIMQLHKKIIKPEEFMKGFPIPPSHAKVIFYLTQKGPSAVSAIGKELCISKSNMTPIIDKLLEDGYVNRYEDPNDRRIIRIELTEKALKIFKLKKEYALASLNERFSTLDDEDINSLIEILCELNIIINKLT